MHPAIYALILTVQYNTVYINTINGFESRELCMAAAQRWLDHRFEVYDRTAVCVQMTYPRDSK